MKSNVPKHPIVLKDGWVETIRNIASPNHDVRPEAIIVTLIVIHSISLPPGQFESGMVENFFTNKLPAGAHPYIDELLEVKVSAHFFVGRSGEITQFVSINNRAWHAGLSTWQEQDNCNDFSVGIEIEGSDFVPFTEEQYSSLNELLKLLFDALPSCGPHGVVGHSDIAPGRKTDPGPLFDWAKIGIER
ncbi:MAG: 1,6-anhydro-N-acetylmuramyl-L-alanine amidase AmpD [Gammaproteobacteria bacterium]|nr:1,6-anhydro-N-acetylmuramyl-L-alanine amidase AmpD [Gammaproteobacteria bacterium]